MKKYVVCFMVTGGITVEAENEQEAMDYFDSYEGKIVAQEEACNSIVYNCATITEIFEED